MTAHGQDENGLQLEKLRLDVSSFFCTSSKKIDIYSCGLIRLLKLRLYLPLDVQRFFMAKLPTTNFRPSWLKSDDIPQD